MSHPIGSEAIEYERYVDGLRKSHSDILKAFRDYFSVPVIPKPGHEAEFSRAARNAQEIISRANKAAWKMKFHDFEIHAKLTEFAEYVVKRLRAVEPSLEPDSWVWKC